MRNFYTSKTTLTHAIAWVIYCAFYILAYENRYPNIYISPVYYVLFFPLLMMVVYTSALYLYPKFLQNRKIVWLVLSLGVFLLIFIGIRYVIVYEILPYLSIGSPKEFTHQELRQSSIHLFFLHAGYGLVIYAFRREKERAVLKENNLLLQVEKAQLEAEKAQIETQQLQTELAMLKSQFNPHLLYNTLNYFYGKIFKLDENLAEHMIKLSDILRYSLEGQPETKVALDNEITYLRSFIELYKLRFGEKAFIDFQVIGHTKYHKIVPLVLISFVENAFKYGDYSQPTHPIRIQLQVSQTQILFRIHNLKRKHITATQQVLSTGLGQENARRRLELICPGEYELTIDNQTDFYTIHLTLQTTIPVLAAQNVSVGGLG